MKVKIENYQAIVNAELEFDYGLTAIIGSTNSGKSSIIRAIKGAINNQGGTGFINYNAPDSSVTVVDKGHTIEWFKSKKGSGKYVIDGREITKIGITQNEEVAQLLNMSNIEVGKDKVNLNFWEQQEKAFLMDKTPGQLFDFISQSKEQEVITSYSEDNKKLISDNKKLIDTFNTQVDVYQAELSKIETYLDYYGPIYAIDVEKIENLEKDLDTLNRLSNEYKEVIERESELNKLYLAAHKKDIELPQETFDNYIKWFNDVSTKRAELDTLQDSIVGLTETLRLYNEDEGTAIKQVDKLKKAVDKHTELTNSYNNINQNLTNLLTIKQDYDTIELNNQGLTKTIEATNNNINNSIKELEGIKVCPLCETPLDKKGTHIHNEQGGN